jgi:hypothetical protein
MKVVQVRLTRKPKYKTTYNRPQYNKVKGNIQRIETHRGCPHQCPFCYEPPIDVTFPLPEIVKNKVQILDMNFFAQQNVLQRIRELGEIKVNDKIVHYEEVCGFDYRFLTQEIAYALKKARFKKVRFAWDWGYKEQFKIKDAINMMLKAGYKRKDISMFMIVNYTISREECEKKLDLLKVWNSKVCDCCFDGGYKYCVPEYWTQKDLTEFRAKCRKHNQLVNFGVDPELNRK